MTTNQHQKAFDEQPFTTPRLPYYECRTSNHKTESVYNFQPNFSIGTTPSNDSSLIKRMEATKLEMTMSKIAETLRIAM